jgi:glutamine amidotransferase
MVEMGSSEWDDRRAEELANQRVVIVDYRLGNLASIRNILKKAGLRQPIVSSDPREILAADKLILPGVGHFGKGMKNLTELGLQPVLEQRAMSDRKPLLGICLGMQLLSEWSDEGQCPGLGFIKGRVERFQFESGINEKIPHMGWNWVAFRNGLPIAEHLDTARFYFVHSYHFRCADEIDEVGTTDYGYRFCSVIQRDNVLGVQFHPEKSHRFGLRLIKNFLEMYAPSANHSLPVAP